MKCVLNSQHYLEIYKIIYSLKSPELKGSDRSDFVLVCTRLILPPCVSALKFISSLSPFHTFYTLPKVWRIQNEGWIHSKAGGWCFLHFNAWLSYLAFCFILFVWQINEGKEWVSCVLNIFLSYVVHVKITKEWYYIINL